MTLLLTIAAIALVVGVFLAIVRREDRAHIKQVRDLDPGDVVLQNGQARTVRDVRMTDNLIIGRGSKTAGAVAVTFTDGDVALRHPGAEVRISK